MPTVRNDVALLVEGYDTAHQRLARSCLQAFSHVGLFNSALNLAPYAGEPPRADGRPDEPTER